MLESKRYFDTENEKKLFSHLDSFYRKSRWDYERISDRTLQIQGVDVIIKHEGQDYYIDEKAQTHYINKSLKTFAFELTYQNKNNEIKKGWLFDETKLTTHYFLATELMAEGKDLKNLSSYRLVSINRIKLIEYLHSLDWNYNSLIDIYRNKMVDGNRFVLSKHNPEARLVKTQHLQETPLNLVIVLDDLISAGVGKEIKKGID